MPNRSNFSTLLTEKTNPRSRRIDRVSLRRLITLMNREDRSVPQRVAFQTRTMEKGVEAIVSSLKKGGRLIFIGAGTSGRLGVLEAAECPPTFSTPPSLVQAIMAGGRSAVFRSKEGAEDNESEGRRQVRKKVRAQDVLVGVAASGVTPFVQAGLAEAKKIGAATILVTCQRKKPRTAASIVIAVPTGPEVITGSTRLKAGTATKLVLNTLTVASMVKLGKIYGNKMVDLQPKSKKLVARGLRLVQEIGRVSPASAKRLLKRAGGHPKTAILMALKKLDASAAKKLLSRSEGHLHRALTGKGVNSHG